MGLKLSLLHPCRMSDFLFSNWVAESDESSKPIRLANHPNKVKSCEIISGTPDNSDPVATTPPAPGTSSFLKAISISIGRGLVAWWLGGSIPINDWYWHWCWWKYGSSNSGFPDNWTDANIQSNFHGYRSNHHHHLRVIDCPSWMLTCPTAICTHCCGYWSG